MGGAGSEDARVVIPLDDGSLLIGGQTSSSNLPVSPDALQTRYGGDNPDTAATGLLGGDMYVARLQRDLTFDSATYFGGALQERSVYGMAVDRLGDIFITTTTRSPNVPGTGGGYRGGDTDILVAKLARRLDRVIWSVYLGGSAGDTPRGGLALGPDGNVYVAGATTSNDYPVTAGTVGTRPIGGTDGVVTKLDAQSGRILLSTRVGGGADEGVLGVTVLRNGDVIVNGQTRSPEFGQGTHGAGDDIVFFRLSYDLQRLVWATALGGSAGDLSEHGMWAEDARLLIPGLTQSPDFPLGQRPGAFVLEVNPDTGAVATVRRVLEGAGAGFTISPVVDAAGRIYVVGQTSSQTLPTTRDALQPSYGGGASDGFLVVMKPDGTIEYASYVGGSGDDLVRAVAERDGKVFLVGSTTSSQVPNIPNRTAGDSDLFVMALERQTP